MFPPDIPPRAWALIAVGVGLAVLVGLALLLVGAVMEFVLVESLRTGEVAVRRYWSRRWRQGVRLFGFRLVVGALLLVGTVVLAAPLLLPALGAGPVGGTELIAFLLLLLRLFVVLAVVVGLVDGFTTAFVSR